jgi:hypothetical protein
MSKTETENELDPWVAAGQYAKLYGELPASFITMVRSCTNASLSGKTEIDGAVSFELKRFLKTDSMRAPFYYYIKTFKPDKLDLVGELTEKTSELFTPFEVGSILPILYIFRRAQRMISEDEWKYLVKDFNLRTELALHIGLSISNIGAGIGILAGSIRYLAMATFLIHDPKGYAEYRRLLKSKKLNYDYSWEQARWGCTHLQVASNLIVRMGFQSKIAQSINTGLEADELKPSLKSDYIAYGVKLIEVWSNALIESGKIPNISHDGDFYPLKEQMNRLIEQAELTLKSGSQYTWLEKVKEDITKDSTPELFS